MVTEHPANEIPRIPTWTPPRLLNTVMIWFLRTPGLQHVLGGWFTAITFKGRRSGALYTTPVTQFRENGTVIISTKRAHGWWRNLRDNPRVVLRLSGRNVRGSATILSDDAERLATLLRFFENRRLDARVYGLHIDGDGRIDPADVRAILPWIVVVRVSLFDDDTG